MLSSKKRLRAEDALRVQRSGFSLSGGSVRLKLSPRRDPESPSRFAVVVSKKVAGGSAVMRNRLRRQAYEALGRIKSFSKAHDVAVTLLKAYKTQKEIEADIKEALANKVV